jgi:hypothetical protein
MLQPIMGAPYQAPQQQIPVQVQGGAAYAMSAAMAAPAAATPPAAALGPALAPAPQLHGAPAAQLMMPLAYYPATLPPGTVYAVAAPPGMVARPLMPMAMPRQQPRGGMPTAGVMHGGPGQPHQHQQGAASPQRLQHQHQHQHQHALALALHPHHQAAPQQHMPYGVPQQLTRRQEAGSLMPQQVSSLSHALGGLVLSPPHAMLRGGQPAPQLVRASPGAQLGSGRGGAAGGVRRGSGQPPVGGPTPGRQQPQRQQQQPTHSGG